MNVFDILFGLLAGLVSCLTPDALLLFPLLLAAAGATGRRSLAASAVGLGLSLVVTGIAAGSLSMFDLDAQSFRRIICAILLVLGLTLMSASLVERFSRLTGGLGSVFEDPGGGSSGRMFRQLFLALLVGANWLPTPGPTLLKASMLAADRRDSGLGYGILFAFGIGAAIPWIIVGRIFRLLLRPAAAPLFDGVAGKRLLGLSLLIVAVLGGSGEFDILAHWLDGVSPAWMRKLAMTF
jgi:cytochrome c-type biogenesis protein